VRIARAHMRLAGAAALPRHHALHAGVAAAGARALPCRGFALALARPPVTFPLAVRATAHVLPIPGAWMRTKAMPTDPVRSLAAHAQPHFALPCFVRVRSRVLRPLRDLCFAAATRGVSRAAGWGGGSALCGAGRRLDGLDQNEEGRRVHGISAIDHPLGRWGPGHPGRGSTPGRRFPVPGAARSAEAPSGTRPRGARP